MANERKVQDDLRRIIGVDGFKKGISAPEEKPPVKGVRGIVYFDSSGNSQSISGTPAEDMQPGADEEEGGQDAGQGDGQGSSGGSNGGNTLETDGVDSPYPVEDGTSEGDGIFSVDDLRLGDQLKGLSGLYDCATGDPVSVRFDGQFTAPDGWDDADSPPVDPTYDEGYYWAVSLNSPFAGGVGSTPSSAASSLASSSSNYSYISSSRQSETQYIAEFGYYNPEYKWDIISFVYRYPCGSSTASYCTTTPYATAWPSDKPMQLSYDADTGKYMTNQYDSNVTPEYSQPVSQFSLCNSNGDPIKSYITADGGQAIYNEATGIAVFKDKDGNVTTIGDGAAVTASQPR